MITIYTWYGRLGNNIIQIINAIYYAEKNNHKCVKIPLHNIFKKNSIDVDIGDNIENTSNFSNRFFFLKELKIYDLEPYMMKKIFNTYIKPIMNIEFIDNYDKENTIYFHFRGGDIFTYNKGQPEYTQPPLIFYKNIIKNYEKVVLVCEDKSNPCINELLKLDNVKYEHNNIQKDLSIFSNASNLGLCFGTFSFLAYLISDNLKNLYIPDFFTQHFSIIGILPNGSWGDDLNVHIVDLPNYIKVGKWKYNDETKKIMLEYNLQ